MCTLRNDAWDPDSTFHVVQIIDGGSVVGEEFLDHRSHATLSCRYLQFVCVDNRRPPDLQGIHLSFQRDSRTACTRKVTTFCQKVYCGHPHDDHAVRKWEKVQAGRRGRRMAGGLRLHVRPGLRVPRPSDLEGIRLDPAGYRKNRKLPGNIDRCRAIKLSAQTDGEIRPRPDRSSNRRP